MNRLSLLVRISIVLGFFWWSNSFATQTRSHVYLYSAHLESVNVPTSETKILELNFFGKAVPDSYISPKSYGFVRHYSEEKITDTESLDFLSIVIDPNSYKDPAELINFNRCAKGAKSFYLAEPLSQVSRLEITINGVDISEVHKGFRLETLGLLKDRMSILVEDADLNCKFAQSLIPGGGTL